MQKPFNIFLFLAVIFGMVGCGGSGDKPAEPSSSTTVQGAIYTPTQAMAIKAAQNYVDDGGFSKLYLENWLVSQGKFTRADAQFATAHIRVDWNNQAAIAAQQQIDLAAGMTRQGMIDQLHSGSLFTLEQAEYGAGKVGL